MDKIFTTLKQIRSHNPCGIRRKDDYGYNKLTRNLGRKYGDNTPLTFTQIFNSNGYDDTLWAICSLSGKWKQVMKHFFLDAADDVKHLMGDRRSTNAVKVARLVVEGSVEPMVLRTTWYSAREAAWETSKDLVWGANKSTARAVARGVAMDAVTAAGLSDTWNDAGRSTVSSSAAALALACGSPSTKDAIRELQMARLFKYCETGERVFTVGG